MIKLKPLNLDGSIVEDESLSFKNHDSVFYKLLLDMIPKLEEKELFKNPQFKNVLGEEFLDEAKEKDHEIEIVFFDNKDIFDWADFEYTCGDGVMGFHAINSGIYESEDSDFLSKKHRVFIYVNDKDWLDIFTKERQKELNPELNNHDGLNLIGMMNTLTHELMHAHEFITNGCGLTPSELGNLEESDDIEYSVSQISTGHGILYPESELECEKDIIDRMEERVEEAGDELLRTIKINGQLFNQALDLIDDHISQIIKPSNEFRQRRRVR